jgi:drug/metabolite transporter (DMT)-like permease
MNAYIGISLLVATGLGWAFLGVQLSYCAQRRIPMVTMLGPQQVLGLLIVFSVVPDYPAISKGLSHDTWLLAAVMLAAGVLNAVGLLALQRAMRMGHHGVTWVIGQSAVILPFLAGMVLFGEPSTAVRWCGVGAIIAGIVALGCARHEQEVERPSSMFSWFAVAASALVLLGVGQVLQTLPSHLAGLADAMRLRIPLLSFGNGAIILVLWLRDGGRPARRTLAMAAIGTVIAVVATLTLFRGLDILAQAGMGALGFPLAIGSSVVGFAVYSAVVLREPVTRWHVAGMALGGLGMLLLASGA